MKKLLPILLALIGTAAGIGAGIFLAPTSGGPSEQARGSHGAAEDAGA